MDVWEMDIRRFGAHYRSPGYTLKRTKEVYETYYDIRYPGHERQAGRPLRTSSAYPWHARARRGVRREVRLGARQLVRVQRGRRRRVAAPARLGGDALVAGDRRRAPRHARARRPVRRVLVRQARGRRAGRGRVPRAAVRQPTSRATSARSPTRRCSTAAAGSSATSPSRASSEELLLDRHRHRVRQPRPRAGSAATRPADGSVRCADVTARWACFALWGPRARDDPRAADRRPARLRLHAHARDRRRRRARCARCA